MNSGSHLLKLVTKSVYGAESQTCPLLHIYQERGRNAAHSLITPNKRAWGRQDYRDIRKGNQFNTDAVREAKHLGSISTQNLSFGSLNLRGFSDCLEITNL